jgi:outer membrane protein assembly factor BamB
VPTDAPTATPTTEPLASPAWSQDAIGASIDVRFVDAGTLFGTTGSGEVVALSAADGRVLWRHEPGGSRPAVTTVGGTALVTSVTRTTETLRGYLEALDPATGARRWTFERPEFLYPVGRNDAVLYVASFDIAGAPEDLGLSEDPHGDGHLRALDLATGEQGWETGVPDLREPSTLGGVGVSVASHGLYAYTHHRRGPREYWDALVAFDHDGDERWRVKTGTYGMDRPVPYEGGVLSGADGDAIAKFDAEGNRDWLVAGWETGPSSVTVTDGGIVVDGHSIGELTRWGELRWLEREGGTVLAPVAEDTVYVERGNVFALDRGRGTPRWVYGPDGDHDLEVHGVVPQGVLVSEGGDWWRRVTLLDGRDGATLGEIWTERTFASTVVRGRRLFLGMDGRVRAYDVEA